MLYQAARPFAVFFVPLVIGEDRHAVLVLAGFALCLRKITIEFAYSCSWGIVSPFDLGHKGRPLAGVLGRRS